MLAIYSKCAFTIAMKMHSTIMSFASGTPFLSVYYDVKSTEYLKMLGIPVEDFGSSVFDNYLPIVLRQIDLMIKNLYLNTQYVKSLKSYEQVKFDETMDKVCNILKTN
jgi:hypothetical protein